MHPSCLAALRSRLIYYVVGVTGDVTTQRAAALAVNLIRGVID